MVIDEKTVSSERIYDGKIIKVDIDLVELENGKMTKRECVRHNGGVAVLFVRGDEIALVNQYRYLYGKAIYEIPAGKRETGEDPEKTAVRELEEETGYVAKTISLFQTLYPTPGYSDEIIYIYLVTNAEKKNQKLDEGEYLNFSFFKFSDVLCQIEHGEICDSKTICAVYKFLYECR